MSFSMENNAERFFNYSRTVANGIIPLQARVVDKHYDPLGKLWRWIHGTEKEANDQQ